MQGIFLKNIKTGMIVKTNQRKPNYGYVYSLGWATTSVKLHTMICCKLTNNKEVWVEVKIKVVLLLSGIVYNASTGRYSTKTIVGDLPEYLEWVKITKQETMFVEDIEDKDDIHGTKKEEVVYYD